MYVPKDFRGIMEQPFSKELDASYQLRRALIEYTAVNHTNRISGLARELGVSLSLVSRYIKGYRPMSSKFIVLVKTRLNGFNYICDNALIAMGEDKWLQGSAVLAVDVDKTKEKGVTAVS